MHIIACLSEDSFASLQRSLATGQTVRRVIERRQLQSEFARGGGDLFVFDPELGRDDFFASVMRAVAETPMPIVLMANLSGRTVARRILAGARYGVSDVLLEPFDVDARSLGARLQLAHESCATTLLLSRLSKHFESLPSRLQLPLFESMFGRKPPVNVDTLAVTTALSRHTIDRWLQRAGLLGPKRVLDAVKLSRLKDRTRAAPHPARSLEFAGFVSRRTAAERCSQLIRSSLSIAMVQMPTSEFVDRLASAVVAVSGATGNGSS